MSKRIFVDERLCNGCMNCQAMCSLVLSGDTFEPTKSKIRVIKVESEGVVLPLLSCDGTGCPGANEELPICVRYCTTGALLYEDIDHAASLIRARIEGCLSNPELKMRADWANRTGQM